MIWMPQLDLFAENEDRGVKCESSGRELRIYSTVVQNRLCVQVHRNVCSLYRSTDSVVSHLGMFDDLCDGELCIVLPLCCLEITSCVKFAESHLQPSEKLKLNEKSERWKASFINLSNLVFTLYPLSCSVCAPL